ncbi:HD family phosphohydrolase [Paenibacillus swuensis]|uniref:HD family phosphohydrolase n=1 Tax=Paenibacillus swuensis TaxID=1178515 RepID=A0A172TN22_9BACL|nr:HD-GYP domain-containing protein [Paenibacillus swuensis]ANE48465.1 HD family phosphohydrolase [Paenibacillus swuensis]
MRVHVTELVNGDTLNKDIYNSYGLMVISSGTVLQSKEISKLYLHSIDYVDILTRATLHDLEPDKLDNPYLSSMHSEYISALQGIESLFAQAFQDGKFEHEQMESSFGPLVINFKQQTDVVTLLLTLNSKDDYTYQHSVQVGMISYYIAKWLGLQEEEALIVGKAGFLHDIGKCRIDESILNKPGRLTETEYTEIKQHTIHGHEIISRSIGSSVYSRVALEHHERMDGQGYPNGKKGDELHFYSRIVAVADVYSAMISSRVYQEKRDLLTVLKELNRCSFGELDPVITQTFIKNMIPNFIGKKVMLKSGETGEIVMNNPNDFFSPLLQIGDQFCDLSKQSEAEIDTIFM